MGSNAALPASLQPYLAWLNDRGNIWLVGGAVRDRFLDAKSTDFDLVTESGAIFLARKFANQFGGAFFPLDESRDTGRVILMDRDTRKLFDFSSLRGSTIEDDLRARDFTINAMAIDIAAPGTLLDPQSGLQDLKDHVLHQCMDDSIAADPIRGMRGIRFASQLQLRIDPQTLEAIKQSGEGLGEVAKERVRDELFRMLDGRSNSLSMKLLRKLRLEMPVLYGSNSSLSDINPSSSNTAHALQALTDIQDVAYRRREKRESSKLIMGEVVLKLRRFSENLESYFLEEQSSDRSTDQLTHFALIYFSSWSEIPERLQWRSLIDPVSARMKLSSQERIFLRPLAEACAVLEDSLDDDEASSRRNIFLFYRTAGSAGVAATLIWLAHYLGEFVSPPPHDDWVDRLAHATSYLSAYFEHPELYAHPVPLLDGNEIIREFEVDEGPLIGQLIEALLVAQAEGVVTNRDNAHAWLQDRISNIKS